MNEHILNPNEVIAFRMGDDPHVTIIASGYADSICNIRIVASQSDIHPPIFMVVGEPCPVIGYFPYTVYLTIPYATDLDYVNFQQLGTKRIPVIDLMVKQENLPKILAKVTHKQVIGYAYNSTDINIAIRNAVSKLQHQYPGNVNAKIIESGFFATGLPVGIAFFYVVMEQQ